MPEHHVSLIRLRPPVTRVIRTARKANLPVLVCPGAMVRAYLQEHVGEGLQSFTFEERYGAVEVLAYVSAQAVPEGVDALPVPEFEPGQELAFQVRACPVVRLREKAGKWRAGVEVDTFLASLERGERLKRGEVYRKWLEKQLGGASLLGFRLQDFGIINTVRHTHSDPPEMVNMTLPQALLTGRMRVQGPAFMQLLPRGVGRHKSFGFGMLKVLPT